MDKFEFGNYESATAQNIVFDSNKGYEEVAGEAEARKQLSNPLNELKDYINKTLPTFQNDTNKVLKLGVNSRGMIGYQQTENGTWVDVASQGHFIEKENDGVVERLPQTSTLRFVDVEINNVDGATIIQGYQGPKGDTGPQGETGPQGPEGPSGRTFEILGHFDTFEELEQLTGESGDAYAVGTSTQNHIYVWNATINDWQDIGILTGAKGDTGPAGPKGDTGPAGQGVASGGTTGQYLVKSSNADYATQWATLEMPVVDDTLDSSSTNAIQNKAVYAGLNDKAPNSHASAETTYGVATTSNYGHTKLANNLTTASHTDGLALSAYQGKVLNDGLLDKASSTHSHGSITNAGAITSDTTVASGDKIVITDSGAGNKIKRSNISFDNSTTNQFLSKKGTWETPPFFIDPSRKLVDGAIGYYEATEDCWVNVRHIGSTGTAGRYIHIKSGNKLATIGYLDQGVNMRVLAPLKKGDTVGAGTSGAIDYSDNLVRIDAHGIK